LAQVRGWREATISPAGDRRSRPGSGRRRRLAARKDDPHQRAAPAVGREQHDLAAVQVGLWGVLDRFKADPFDDGRMIVQATTFDAARDAAPWGTGLGTFRRVYEQREPVEAVIQAYVNRAHNDWLEFYLEAGWPGLFLLSAWIIWWLVATWRAGRSDGDRADPAMRLVRRLAVVALVAVAIHSLVDFPMRTIALSTVVAAMVAISVSPRGVTWESAASRARGSGVEP